MSAGAFMNGESDLPHILASLRALLTPTEQLPGQQSASQNLLLTVPQQQHAIPAPAQGAGGTATGGNGASSLLSNGNTLSKLVNLLSGTSLAGYASGAPANSAVSAALGSVGAQTAPTATSIQAGNDAALAASDGGAAGASAGLLGMGGLSSGAAADAAVTGTLGSVGAQTAGEAAAIQAANDAALGGSAAGSAAGGAAAGGSLAGAAGALGLVALPIAAGLLTNGVDIPNSTFVNELNTVKAGQALGYQQNGTINGQVPQNWNTPGPNGGPSWQDWNGALAELQGGAYQQNEPWIQAALNQLGYQEYGQMNFQPTHGGGGGGLVRGIKSF